jgi:two-component system sensor histidine kinase KdpD
MIVAGVLTLLSLTYTVFVRVNLAMVAVSFLLVVLVSATYWGLAESLAASVIGAFYLNFLFLPPFHSLAITHSQDWAAFLAFLATSLIVSQLSARAKRRTVEILTSRNEMERLYRVSCAMLLMNPNGDVRKYIAEQIADIFGLRSVLLLEVEGQPESVRAGPESLFGIDDKLHEAATQGLFFADGRRQIIVVPVLRAENPIGALAVCGLTLSRAALNALANQVAIGLAMARAQQIAARAEATRQSQELKSALLDAIAHEFKTPLTTIKAASTAVLADFLTKQEDIKDLLGVIDAETDRLGTLVTDVIQTARIEAGEIQLIKQLHRMDELVLSVLEEMKQRTDGGRLRLSQPRAPTSALCDATLIRLLLRLLVDNALKYSPPSSPVEITVNSTGQQAVISVADRGSGIPESERLHIFERFYRLKGDRQGIPGSGMGLTIARYIAEAHSGSLSASDRVGGGSVFSLSLPLSSREDLT